MESFRLYPTMDGGQKTASPRAASKKKPERERRDSAHDQAVFLWNYLPLPRSRAPERLPKRELALFEPKPSLQAPGSIEEHRVSRQRRDKWLGAFSFSFFFFGQAKKKDRSIKRIPRAAEIAWQSDNKIVAHFPPECQEKSPGNTPPLPRAGFGTKKRRASRQGKPASGYSDQLQPTSLSPRTPRSGGN